ncbi:tol-pal system protein YbgF [Rhizobium sp. Leaf341]|uniref:tol-pal system protein YbgF n=1 Tax=Rhizobium sp. Leaf341 TaxID=1736344 RepID=UPI0007150C4E|nr:tol-pal system protein YbgF [Rhizobium sp. Leaf341]KQR75808.1 tol-pal system protein [Rhizobium sp. Leaf341]
MKNIVVAAMIGLGAFGSLSQPVTAMPLSGWLDKAFHRNETKLGEQAPLLKVQASEAGRIGQLEETIRSLNGRIEEMSFQLLQMQEQIRKFQEDNELRFQDLEGGKAAAPRKSGALETPRTSNEALATTGRVAPSATVPDPGASTGSETAARTLPGVAPGASTGGNGAQGSLPTTLGQIILDDAGNPIGANAENLPEPGAVPGGASGTDIGSVASTSPNTRAAPGLNATPETEQQTASLDNPGDLYQSAYGHVLSGDYSQAENEFRSYLDAFPSGEKAADASFWMGEAQYSQGKFNDSAKTFLNAHQAFSKSPKAPEMLLKLGMSLAALDNKETACATLREVGKRYPKASPAVKAKVTSEQSRLSC